MNIAMRFIASGVSIGVLITLSIYIYKTIPTDYAVIDDHYSSKESGRFSATSASLFSGLNDSGYKANVVFSVLYHLRENELDKAKAAILAIDDEEHRFSIVETVADYILEKASPDRFYEGDKNENVFNVTLAKEFGPKLLEVIKEIEPKQASNQFMDALQIVIKLLTEAGENELARTGIIILDNHLAALTPIYNEQRALDKYEASMYEEQYDVNESLSVLILGALITGTLASIGFVLSLLLGPLFKHYGDGLVSKVQSGK